MSKKTSKPDADNQPLATPEAEAAARAAHGDGDATIPDGMPGETAGDGEAVCADHFHHSHGHVETSLGLLPHHPPILCGGPGKCAPCTLHLEIVTSRQQRLADPAAPWVGPDGKQYGQEQINAAGRVAGDILTFLAVSKK